MYVSSVIYRSRLSEDLPDVNTEIDNMKQTVVKVSRLLTRSFIC